MSSKIIENNNYIARLKAEIECLKKENTALALNQFEKLVADDHEAKIYHETVFYELIQQRTEFNSIQKEIMKHLESAIGDSIRVVTFKLSTPQDAKKVILENAEAVSDLLEDARFKSSPICIYNLVTFSDKDRYDQMESVIRMVSFNYETVTVETKYIIDEAYRVNIKMWSF